MIVIIMTKKFYSISLMIGIFLINTFSTGKGRACMANFYFFLMIYNSTTVFVTVKTCPHLSIKTQSGAPGGIQT
jgi:hypothetical protein